MKKTKSTRKTVKIFLYGQKSLKVIKLTLMFMLIFSVNSIASSGNSQNLKDANETGGSNSTEGNNFRLVQQQIEVTGTVTDAETGEPLPGVNVIEGTTQGTTTDRNGNFSIEVPPDANLAFSFIGYKKQFVEVNGRQEINVALEPEVTELDEVVAIGYGTQQKSDLTGSVFSLNSESFSEGANVSMDQLIGNKSPGVRFVQSGNQPGSGVSINIRGAGSVNAGTSPLYVIDGLPLDKSRTHPSAGEGFTSSTPRNPLNSINPGDIESIEILKDASATAIYGSRGANGVILITTKQGETGKPRINYNGYTGVQYVANRHDVLNATEYRDVLNSIIDDGGGNPEQRVEEIHNGGTDWQNEIYNNGAKVTDHKLSLSGGSDDLKYFTSLGYFEQEGILKGSSVNRYSARVNLDYEDSEIFKAGIRLNTSYTLDDYTAHGFGINYFGGSIQGAVNYDPTVPVRNEDGSYYQSTYITIDNPVATIEDQNSSEDTYRTSGVVFGEYFILPALSFKLNIGGDINNSARDTYVGRQTQFGRSNQGIATRTRGTKSNYLVEGTLNFDEDFGEHSINATTGMTYQRFVTDRSYMNAKNFPSDATGANNLGLADPSML